MTVSWAASLPRSSVASLASIRHAAGISILDAGDVLWLRGAAHHEETIAHLPRIAGIQRFDVLAGGELREVGRRVPLGHLPDGTWTKLSDYLTIEQLPAALGGETPAPRAISIVRDGTFIEPTYLMATLDDWACYAATAPAVRLDRLQFAANSSAHVLIRGEPLPPIRGARYVDCDGILVPAGWTWSPRIESALLRQRIRLAEKDVALFSLDGSFERIPADVFVRATRSAVRRTAGEFAHGRS